MSIICPTAEFGKCAQKLIISDKKCLLRRKYIPIICLYMGNIHTAFRVSEWLQCAPGNEKICMAYLWQNAPYRVPLYNNIHTTTNTESYILFSKTNGEHDN